MIVDRELARTAERLSSKHITLNVDTSAKALLSKDGYHPSYGARPLKRVIQQKILDPLSLLLIEGKVREGGIVTVTAKNGAIVCKPDSRRMRPRKISPALAKSSSGS